MTLDPISLGLTLALNAASMAANASRRIEGPRLSDLSVTVAEYGTPISSFMGIRRFEGTPIIFAEPIKEVKKRRKTKGGKYNDYSYFGTWAVLIADHLIGAVTRIWFDKHLVYDATGKGPLTPFSLGEGFALDENLRIYLGTEDQQPDPRMQATVDAKHGAGSTPAYRGVAYIMFEEVPLAQIGNRIPQVSIEAVTAAEPSFPFDTRDGQPPSMGNLMGFTFSPDGSYFFAGSNDYELWDTASRSRLIAGTLPTTIYGNISRIGLSNTGTIYGIKDGDYRTIVTFAPDGLTAGGEIAGLTVDQTECWVVADGNGAEHLFTRDPVRQQWHSFGLSGVGGVVAHVPENETGHQFYPRGFFADAHGDVWLVGTGDGKVYLQRVVDTGARPGSLGLLSFDPPGSPGGIPDAAAAHYGGNFVVWYADGNLYLIDEDDGAIVDSVAAGADTVIVGKQFANLRAGAASIWLSFAEVSLADLSTIRTVDPLDWKNEDSDGVIYDPLNNALISAPQFTDVVTWRYLDRIGSTAVTLGDIVERVAATAGIAPGDIDATALDQPVAGYSWTQGSGKDILEPLLDLYDSDAREHGFVLSFVKRGGTSASTIPSTSFAADGEGAEAGSLYDVDRGLSTEVPRRLTLSFADIDADQQTNSVSEARPVAVVEGDGELSIDMTTLAGDVTTMRGLAQRLLRRRWMGRETVQNGLPATRIALEPADVATLVLDGVSRTSRLTLIALDADQVMRCEWERDDPSIAALTTLAGAGFDGRAPSVIAVPLPSKAFVLDIPLIADAHAALTPSLYHAAAPYADGGTWPGETLFQSLDSGGAYDQEKAAIPSTSPAVWGVATNALADANPNLWDRGNSVNVRLQAGTLDGTTEAMIDVAPMLNLALLGDELIQFTTATLEGDGTYTLTGLKRGRRGTEWATVNHAAGEAFVLLDAAVVVAMGASDIGTTLYFKGATVGRDATGAFPVTLAFTGASLKPYAPAQISAVKDAGTGDWSISLIRRTRIGGAWTGGATIPLSEASEAYEIDILNGVGAVVRTIAVTAPSATYSAAQQSADGGDVPIGSLHLRACQMSDTVGRGFVALADF